MATLQERFAAVEAKLDEASAEILADIQALKDLGLTPEADVILGRIEAKAQALADIVPNAPPTP